MKDLTTPTLLCLYFGLETGRSIKRKDLHSELVRRGVSIVTTTNVLTDLLFCIGYAADNRIPDIDDQLDCRSQNWQCGCGHWNSPSLPFCAVCERKPGEKS